VTEISSVIGQSQPRTKPPSAAAAGRNILERAPEGAHVFYRVCDGVAAPSWCGRLADQVPAGTR